MTTYGHDNRRILQDNFDEWGPIERIYNVASKTIAFVQYYWRASAEFAKEAMQVSAASAVQQQLQTDQAMHSHCHTSAAACCMQPS